MTYKKRHKYRKTIKLKKRGGSAALTGGEGAGVTSGGLTGFKLPDAAGKLADMKGAAAGKLADMKGAAAGKLADMKGKAAGKLADMKGKAAALTGSSMPSKKISKSTSPFIMIAEFILKLRTQAKLNYSLASKLFKSPRLRENKYNKQIILLKPPHIENFKCACKLIYLYYYDEYATNYSFMIDNAQEIDNMCKMFFVIQQQTLIYSSTKTKLLSHFNEIFENTNFSELYNENLMNIETDCNLMRSKIQGLFKKNDKDYSYIILDLLFDLLNQTSIYFVNIMNEITENNQTKMCDISSEMPNILYNCQEKNTYDLGMILLHPETLIKK